MVWGVPIQWGKDEQRMRRGWDSDPGELLDSVGFVMLKAEADVVISRTTAPPHRRQVRLRAAAGLSTGQEL